MTDNELKREVDKIAEGLNKKFEDSERRNKDLQEQIDELTKRSDKFNVTPGRVNKNFGTVLEKEAKTALTKMKEAGNKTYIHEFKSDIMGVGQGYNSGAGVVLEDREPGIHQAPLRKPVILDYIPQGTTTSDTVSWLEKTSIDGVPLFKKELETAPLRKYKLARKTRGVKKIMVASHYSREAMEDIDGFVAELRRDLLEQMERVLDKNLWDGDGGDTELLGLTNMQNLQIIQAPVNYQITKPSILDVIALGVTQIREEHHEPTVVIVSPRTFLDMRTVKTGDGQYILPPYVSASGASFDGLPVVVNTLLDPDEIFIMDGRIARFNWRRAYQLEISDSHGDFFLDDVMTVKLTCRGVLRVKECDEKGLAYSVNYKNVVTQLGCATCPTAPN
jgi:HK97 family phage major capsid protein